MNSILKKRIIIGGVASAMLCTGFGSGYLIARNGGVDEFIEDTILSKSDKSLDKNKDKNSKNKDNKVDAGSAGAKKDGAAGAGNAGNTTKTGYVDNGGASVGGTSAENSYSIKMSELCTFTDPSGISFDTRYVLYGGPDCIPAKRAAAAGVGTCKGAYAILYTSGGKAVGEYICYVMSNEAEAQSLAAAFSGYDASGNWGDVAYVYSSGSYVQTSIDTYYLSLIHI